MSGTPTLGGLGQDYHVSEASVGYTVRFHLKSKNKRKSRKRKEEAELGGS